MGTCALDTGADFTSKPAHEKHPQRPQTASRSLVADDKRWRRFLRAYFHLMPANLEFPQYGNFTGRRSPVMTSSSIVFDSLSWMICSQCHQEICKPVIQILRTAFDPCKIQLLTRPLLAITIELTGFRHAPIPPKTPRRRVFVVARGDYSSEPQSIPQTNSCPSLRMKSNTPNITGTLVISSDNPNVTMEIPSSSIGMYAPLPYEMTM